MRSTSNRTASAVVGGLVLLCASSVARAQSAPQIQPVAHVASLAPGSILGTVQDERGVPVAGAMVSALGTTTSVAVTDRAGRFELRTLTPGPYLVRAHLSGYVASRGQVVEVRPSARTSSSISLHRSTSATTSGNVPILAAGVPAAPAPAPAATPDPGTDPSGDDHGEMAWRLRHARRGILKDATIPEEILVGDTPPDTSVFGPTSVLGHAIGSPARLASTFFSGMPFTGQVNLLTTGSFDAPLQLFTTDSISRGVTYLTLSAPVGAQGDWTVRAALTQGDIASWIVAGDYTTRAPARHRYEVGWSYATQRYDGGNLAALTGVTDGSRNAGTLYASDTFAVTRNLTVTWGGRYSRYDYLDERSLFSPRAVVTIEPVEHLRFSGTVSHRAVAPGAEEFLPQADAGMALPPQRTFSAIDPARPLEAERTDHLEVGVERDIANATVSVRAFRQQIADQIVTLFGLDMPGVASHVGHYFLGDAGSIEASGVSAGVRASIGGRVHGAIEYSTARGRTNGGDSYLLLLAPSAARFDETRIHDVSTSIVAEVPETSTRVIVLYRISNAFAHPPAMHGDSDGPALDSRFDVQVRQSLPFMDFSSAKWEALVGVRNFVREAAPDQSIYDELLVVRPPKRVVGGLTLKF